MSNPPPPPFVTNGWRYLAFDAHDGELGYLSEFYAQQNVQVGGFASAVLLRNAVRDVMLRNPDWLCVVQNPPDETDTTLPLGVIVATVDEALCELSTYANVPTRSGAGDWTPMVVWFTTAADKARVADEVSLDHRNPTPLPSRDITSATAALSLQ